VAASFKRIDAFAFLRDYLTDKLILESATFPDLPLSAIEPQIS